VSGLSRAAFAELRAQREDTKKMAEAAVNNEFLTRHRVEALEGILGRGFWGRLRWLLFGR
jgi:hypothetical protein